MHYLLVDVIYMVIVKIMFVVFIYKKKGFGVVLVCRKRMCLIIMSCINILIRLSAGLKLL